MTAHIGDAERAEAQRALQVHLGAGRLTVDEFVTRFARAANAVTAAQIAALFTGLPAPHPQLPEPPVGHRRRNLAIVGVVAVLVLAGLLGTVTDRDRTAPASSVDAVAAPGTSSAGPPSSAASAENATVRRSTGQGVIVLRPSQGVDLDDPANPAWNVGFGCCGRDVEFDAEASRLTIAVGHAGVSGPLGFATCLRATAYTGSAIERRDLRPGDIICVRTDGHRLALITIVDVGAQAVEFGATVWDPPVP